MEWIWKLPCARYGRHAARIRMYNRLLWASDPGTSSPHVSRPDAVVYRRCDLTCQFISRSSCVSLPARHCCTAYVGAALYAVIAVAVDTNIHRYIHGYVISVFNYWYHVLIRSGDITNCVCVGDGYYSGLSSFPLSSYSTFLPTFALASPLATFNQCHTCCWTCCSCPAWQVFECIHIVIVCWLSGVSWLN